jgi:hypothetical protein
VKPAVWIIGFVARGRVFWWDWLLRGPWRHVVAYRYDLRSDCWIAIDWSQNEMAVLVLRTDEVAAFWTDHVQNGGFLMRWEGTPGPVSSVLPCWPAYCIPIIAHALGLKRWVVTPRGLASALRATGGTPFLLDDTAQEQENDHGKPDGHVVAQTGPGRRRSPTRG